MQVKIIIASAALAFATAGHAAPKPEHVNECNSIAKQVEALEAEARKPMSAQAQDANKARLRAVRDRQFSLKC